VSIFFRIMRPIDDPTPESRVKIYFLSSGGDWDDRGTGYAHIVPDDDDFLLMTTSEEAKEADGTPKVVLTTRISLDDIYVHQHDTLIVWNDPWLETEMALSFQSVTGCQQFWDEIQTIQGKSVSSPLTLGTSHEEEWVNWHLPDPSIPNLSEIHALILNPGVPKDVIASQVLSDHYLEKIFDVFEKCEDIEDTDSLTKLFDIAKSLVLLNQQRLLRELFSETYFMRLVGILEYDPEVTPRQRHRDFLRNTVVFRELIALPDDVKQSIHQQYRIQYFRDTVLPTALDDAVFNTIGSFSAQLQAEIVRSLYNDRVFLQQLFERLATETDGERIADLTALIQEFVTSAKALSPTLRLEFYTTLTEYGLFNLLGTTLLHPNARAQRQGLDVVWQAAHQEPRVLRGFLAGAEERVTRGNRFLKRLVAAIVHGTGDSVKGQAMEALRTLLDVNSDIDKSGELSEILQEFYAGTPSVVELLCEPILRPRPELVSPLPHVLDLLAAFVPSHSHRMRRFILQTNLLGKAAALMGPGHPSHLQIAVVRFLKATVQANNAQYTANLVRVDALAPLAARLLMNGPSRYNILNSAILSFFEVIRKENIKALVVYTVEHFPELLAADVGTDVFSDMKAKYEQHLHREGAREVGGEEEGEGGAEDGTGGGKRIPAAPFNDLRDDEDEGYFSTEAAPDPEPAAPALDPTQSPSSDPTQSPTDPPAREPPVTPPRAGPPPKRPAAALEEDESALPLCIRAAEGALRRPPPSRVVDSPRPVKARRLETAASSSAGSGGDGTEGADDDEEDGSGPAAP